MSDIVGNDIFAQFSSVRHFFGVTSRSIQCVRRCFDETRTKGCKRLTTALLRRKNVEVETNYRSFPAVSEKTPSFRRVVFRDRPSELKTNDLEDKLVLIVAKLFLRRSKNRRGVLQFLTGA